MIDLVLPLAKEIQEWQFAAPSWSEGFDDLYRVTWGTDGDFVVRSVSRDGSEE